MARIFSFDLKETLAQALCLPEYRDWALSLEVIKARLKLLAVFGVLSFAGAIINIWIFMLAFSLVLGLGIAVGFDVFLAGSIEGSRRLREKVIGGERVEEKRLEDLARVEYNGVLLSPAFLQGLQGGLWVEMSVVERAASKKIAPTLAAKLGQAKTYNRKRWLPSASLSRITRAVEPVGQQFFSIWLEKTAIPYWSGLELEARRIADTPKA